MFGNFYVLDMQLSGEKEKMEEMMKKLNEVMEELRVCREQKSALDNQIADSDKTVKELEEKIVSAVGLLVSVKKQRDELQFERDNAVREAEELRERMAEEGPKFFSEFSLMEIEEATQNFDPSLIIAKGECGIVYKGVLRNTDVAIKKLHSNKFQGCLEFEQEVDILSKVRHPNLVSLIGACPEAGCLIYESLPGGSLEDRLSCKDNTPPLSWQTRIRITVEICSALIFLHSHKPQSIVHGDLKPTNIFLDANFVSKLGVFDIFGLVSYDETTSANSVESCCRASPKGNIEYMAPEFFTTGKLTPKSDVYSFGNILLRLLMGRDEVGIIEEVQYAVEKGNLSDVLDESAGDWPFIQAKQLAHLALRCCEMNRKSRPDLRLDVWKVLEPLKASYGTSVSFRQVQRRVPSYFLCPIFQEIMRDPCVAADGFTYEAEALRAWLGSGHNTSPMTNLKLDHHNLIPNYSLRSAIQEWQHEP